MTTSAACDIASTSACPFHVEPLTLAEARERFEREAKFGCCDTGRYRCPYYTWGAGPTLLCVPGLADDSQVFLLVLAHLSRHFRCVAYNWPTGLTDGARLGRYHHRDFVADLFALLDHLKAKQAYPVGYSFGSTVVMSAMETQPHRFPRAVLLHGFARRQLAPAERLLAAFARYWKGPLRDLPLRDWVFRTTRRGAFARREAALWDYYIEHINALPMGPLARRALMLDQLDLRPHLPNIRQQVLLICGDGDPLVSKQCESDLLTGLPNISRVELSDCGHMAIYTHPEVLAELIAEFLLTSPQPSVLPSLNGTSVPPRSRNGF